MLDKEKIVKVELYLSAEQAIVSAEKDQLSFPRMFINDVPVDNIIIIKGKDMPGFDIGHKIYVVTYMMNGDRIRYTGIVRMSLPHQVNVQLQNDYGTLMPERRRYFKVDADLNCSVYGYTREGEEYEYEIPLAATIRNISIGGIFLMCTDQKFNPDDTLQINFKIDGELVGVTAKVLRAQKKNDGGIEGYGCQFINTDQGQEERFAKLVYNIQLQKRNERMEREERRLDAKKR